MKNKWKKEPKCKCGCKHKKAETIITKIKKRMVNGGKVYGGYWTKETCA